ncbi:MAG TPA: hypothetical protein VJ772_00120 [Nitrososphaeraceae archaeon]|nr:hypothetical protein [Nitrososphaeraceae archaeon]
MFPINGSFSEVYSSELSAKCNFQHDDQNSKYQCYKHNIEHLVECISTTYTPNETSIMTQSPHPPEFVSNLTSVRSELPTTVNFSGSQYTIWKSEVEPLSMPREKFDNIAEPSIASNSTHVFYTGNYFAAKSKIGDEWKYVDPTFDFRGFYSQRGNVSNGNVTVSNQTDVNLFLADQRTIFDPERNMFLWLRLGEPYLEGKVTNILRLAVSNDTMKWTVFDFVPIDIFRAPDIIESTFDYPQVILTNDFAYITSSLVIGDNCEREYGTILRISLNDLSNSLNRLSKLTYTAVLDRNVTGIAPIDGSYNDTAYFGAHLKNTSNMKIIKWEEDSNAITNQTVSIAPWNNIRNSDYCGTDPSDSDLWWCKAHTSSRIRSAWLYNDSLNFMWNAITTYDNGATWKPYIDVATFNINNNMSYDRKYHIADASKQWIFGSAIPSFRGDLGVIAYYVTSNNTDPDINPYFNLAFGQFNHSSSRWDMIPLINSTHSIPVKDEKNNDDHNFGDFITIRQHPPHKNSYLWDIGGYVIVGNNYYDVAPYFIMVK